MTATDWTREQAMRSLERLWPRVVAPFRESAAPDEWQAFETRLRNEWDRLFGLLFRLYGAEYDFFYHLESILHTAVQSWLARPTWLKELDEERSSNPDWFQSQHMVGGVCYVDRFAGTLAGVRHHIPYLKDLGLTYLHLMPLFAAPEGNSDGGYAVSSYRDVDSKLGTTAELAELAYDLHTQGITLVVDFVFNHTSDEHIWARQAQQGYAQYERYYFLFPDRTMPDAYERTLREIFPSVRRGNFFYREDMQRWVWTTFNNFQWDLNYANPEVFRAMAEEMLFIANLGIGFLRLDAVAFIWKRMDTGCENLPEAHLIIQAYNSLCRIAAPSLLFKSEAIVHPDDVLSYIGKHECQVSYNPLLMALLWEALATREVKLLEHSMRYRFALPHGTAWINYLRSHDDIGWTFDDGDAQWEWIQPYNHRQFLNRYYTGKFEGTFAAGVGFQENPTTGDARVCGTLASLAGLEKALAAHDPVQIDLAVQRVLMLHSIILSIGGIPLLYLGDEWGTLNDYSYVNDPALADDSRWVHRPRTDWIWRADVAQRPDAPHTQIYHGLRHQIQLRKQQAAFWNGSMQVVETGNPHIFAFVREHDGQRILVAANFSEFPQAAPSLYIPTATDLLSGTNYQGDAPLQLAPCQSVWMVETMVL